VIGFLFRLHTAARHPEVSVRVERISECGCSGCATLQYRNQRRGKPPEMRQKVPCLPCMHFMSNCFTLVYSELFVKKRKIPPLGSN
jgi:hypothetical protein